MPDTEYSLAQQLVKTDSSALLKRDMDKLLAMNTASGNDERDNLKAEAFNRILLLLGSGNATISGTSYDQGRGEFISQSKQASDIDMPIGMYMSGHMGRNYMHFPGTQAKQVLGWVAGKGGTHQKAYSFADNQEKQLQGKEVIFDRHAATHSAQYKKGQVKELKGATYGAAGFLGRIANPRTLGTMDRYTPLRWLTYPLSLTACTVYNTAALIGNV